MATIKAVLNRIAALNVEQVAADSLRETADAITEAIHRQTFAGKRSDGSQILPEYSDLTLSIKMEKNQPTNRVTLNDTGEYYRSIKTDVVGSRIVTEATDDKAQGIMKKYQTARGRLLKPGGKYKQDVIDEHLNPVFMRKIKNASKLK